MIKKLIIGIGVAIYAVAAFADNPNVQVINPPSRPVVVSTTGGLAAGINQKGASSGNVANATATATLAAVAGRTNYLEQFSATAAGATGALAVNLTVTGLAAGTQTYTFVFPAGVAVAAYPLVVNFDPPLKASAANTAITVSLPAGGTGNTNAAVNVYGFDL